jgi:hypothetical protein
VAVSTGVTVPSELLRTYTVAPSGVTATASGPGPTAIGVPVVLVAVAIGVRVLSL